MQYRSLAFLSILMLVCGLPLSGCVKETEAESACDDGQDNDLDGLYDCDDPDCEGLGGCPGEPGDDDAADDDAADDDGADDDAADDDAADDDAADDDTAGDDDSAAGDDDSATV